jgi:2,5-furandicarboxylate decarboxylase 1
VTSDLRGFLEQVRTSRRRDFVEVEQVVSPRHETTAILTKLEERQRSPIVLFKNVAGSPWPLVTNVCGSRGRLALALDCPLRDLSARWAEACENQFAPVLVEDGRVQEHVLRGSEVDLGLLPAMVYHEHDAPHPYLTGGVAVARDPDTGVNNLSFHRLMVADNNRTGIFMEPGKHLDLIYKKCAARGEPLPVSVFFGCHPAWYLGALYSGPRDVDEYGVIGGLLGRPLEVVQCVSVESLVVPARAEVVLEGFVHADESMTEGPFGEFTGHGTGVTETPVFNVTAMTFRSDPIFQDIVSGHMEHLVLPMLALEYRANQSLRQVSSNVTGISFAAPLTIVVALDKSDDGEPERIIRHVLASDIYVKHVIVIGSDVDPSDLAGVMRSVALNVQADRDVFILSDQEGTPLDPSAPSADGRTSKMGIDATMALNPSRAITRNSLPRDVLDSIDLAAIFGQ